MCKKEHRCKAGNKVLDKNVVRIWKGVIEKKVGTDAPTPAPDIKSPR